jgi:hypothetical protein
MQSFHKWVYVRVFRRRGLADFALIYFDILVGEYDSFPWTSSCDSETKKLADELRYKYKHDRTKVTWGDLCAFDRLLLRLRTVDEIRERIPALEARYIEIAGPTAYANHLLKSPIDLASAKEDQLRARADAVVSELYGMLTVAACRENLRDRASTRLNWWIVAFVFVFVFSGFFNLAINPPNPPNSKASTKKDGASAAQAKGEDSQKGDGERVDPNKSEGSRKNDSGSAAQAKGEDSQKSDSETPAQTKSEDLQKSDKRAATQAQSSTGSALKPTIQLTSRLSGTVMAVLFAGALGGFLSAQRRVHSSAKGGTLLDLITLSQEGPMHSTAPVNGAVFALVLYTMFMGGLINGPLFPQMNMIPDQKSYLRFWEFFLASGPTSSIAWGQLLVWSFAAGFLERLVPDALGRLAKKSSKDKK